MKPYVQDSDFTLYQGDALAVLRELPDESVHMVVTSPPYWGLRDYGTGLWEGGNTDCDHIGGTLGRQDAGRDFTGGGGNREGSGNPGKQQFRDVCGKCGARRVDQQLGLEPTPEAYVARMVDVFREVRRVLRADGTCWLNIGSSYAANRSYQVSDSKHKAHDYGGSNAIDVPPGYKPKDMVPIPWLLALALQADGWYLRADIIWSKPNPMPESVTDRPTKAHEYVFLLSKGPRYYFDTEAVREKAEWNRWGDQTVPKHGGTDTGAGWIKPRPKDHFRNSAKYVEQGLAPSNSDHAGDRGEARGFDPTRGRNVRSVWEIATEPFAAAHFATFPQALVERCVKAGTSERGCCGVCGKPWEREVERVPAEVKAPGSGYGFGAGRNDGGRSMLVGAGATTLGWRPGCDHEGEPVPAVCLDPFLGSGTSALVARRLGRRTIGIELSPEYCALAATRLQQLSLLAEPA